MNIFVKGNYYKEVPKNVHLCCTGCDLERYPIVLCNTTKEINCLKNKTIYKLISK